MDAILPNTENAKPVYELDNHIVSVGTQTLFLLLSSPDYQDALILYFFYIKTAKMQNSVNVWAGNDFCMKGLKWGDHRMKAAKKQLRNLDLIEDSIDRDDKTGQVKKHYLKVKFIWKPSGADIAPVASGAGSHLVAGVGQMQDIINKMQDKEMSISSKPAKNKKDDFLSFLDAFNEFFKSRYRPTAERRHKYEVRRVMFTHEEIMEALANLNASAWHHGENDRGWVADPDFLLRNDEQVDKWLQKARPAPPIEPALRTSRNSFVPCSDLEIWEMAGEIDVAIDSLKEKQAEILRMAADGGMSKYPKETNTYDTLKRWVIMARDRGRIPRMGELERIGYPDDHPDKVAERNKAFDFIRNQEKT